MNTAKSKEMDPRLAEKVSKHAQGIDDLTGLALSVAANDGTLIAKIGMRSTEARMIVSAVRRNIVSGAEPTPHQRGKKTVVAGPGSLAALLAYEMAYHEMLPKRICQTDPKELAAKAPEASKRAKDLLGTELAGYIKP